MPSEDQTTWGESNERRSSGHRRIARTIAVAAAISMAAIILAGLRIDTLIVPASARDALVTMHALWTRVAAPGMQFPAGRVSARAIRLWAVAFGACVIPRLGSQFEIFAMAR